MGYKIDSLLIILQKLDQGERLRLASIMDLLEISRRTALRYIQSLRVAGFPVDYDKKNNTYYLGGQYKLDNLKKVIDIEDIMVLALQQDFNKHLISLLPGMFKEVFTK